MIVLQKFDFKESKYERPQDKWVCGHLAEGKPCALGPSRKGACRVTTTCKPRLEGGRWQCRRSAQEGGPCEVGPYPDGRCGLPIEPCVPQPSLRTKRNRATLWATALAVGLVSLFLAGGTANKLLMPGALSSHHAGLLECQSCHGGSGAGQMDWAHQFVMAVGPKQNAQLCLNCHNMGAQPFTAHTHPVEALTRITQFLKQKTGGQGESWFQRISFGGSSAKNASNEIFCAACHREHQGEFNDLKKVSNERCQTCHVAKFASFGGSHPQFTKYPYNRRTRIIFDHVSHFGKNFEDAVKAAPKGQLTAPNCVDCHQLGVDQKYMEVKPFEVACGNCHTGDILGTTRTAGTKGINFFAVPYLDTATLADHNIDIGEWPDVAEGTLTPFMKLLMAASGETAAAALGDLDLGDLGSATDEQLAKVKELAWAVKRTFNRFESTPLETAISGGRPMPPDERKRMATLSGTISRDVIMGANRDWFPHLREELAKHEKGEPTVPQKKDSADAPDKEPSAVDSEAWAEFGGWYRQEYSIRYRPAGHADPFLRAWLDFASRAYGTPQEQQLTPVFDVLAAQDAVGRCTKCHSIDGAGGTKAINWQPFRNPPIKNRFTTFAHKPHINAVGDKSCGACHELNKESGDYLKAYETGNPSDYTPNFKYLDKALCASCHTRQRAWESCTLCHNYHVNVSNEHVPGTARRAAAEPGAGASARNQTAGSPGK